MTGILLVSAQNVVIDKNSNQVSVINIIDNASSSTFPFQLPMSILISVDKESHDEPVIDLILEIKLETFLLLQHPFKVTFMSKRKNATLNLQGLVIPKEGTIHINVLYKNNKVLGRTVIISKNSY